MRTLPEATTWAQLGELIVALPPDQRHQPLPWVSHTGQGTATARITPVELLVDDEYIVEATDYDPQLRASLPVWLAAGSLLLDLQPAGADATAPTRTTAPANQGPEPAANGLLTPEAADELLWQTLQEHQQRTNQVFALIDHLAKPLTRAQYLALLESVVRRAQFRSDLVGASLQEGNSIPGMGKGGLLPNHED